jgi:RNA polymerase sigma-70 factor (ECF subfamily)
MNDVIEKEVEQSDSVESKLSAIRPKLLAFANMHLNGADDAEDVVQETLTAAWHKKEQFKGSSKFETWVFGILRYKLLDAYRDKKRVVPFEYVDMPDPNSELFDNKQHWAPNKEPNKWANPEAGLENDHFWQIFDICVYQLPANSARIFSMRELLGLETGVICESLSISEANCWTLLHRARLKLRSCLEKSWFQDQGARA